MRVGLMKQHIKQENDIDLTNLIPNVFRRKIAAEHFEIGIVRQLASDTIRVVGIDNDRAGNRKISQRVPCVAPIDLPDTAKICEGLRLGIQIREGVVNEGQLLGFRVVLYPLNTFGKFLKRVCSRCID